MDFSTYTDRWNEGDYFYRVKTFCYNECNSRDEAFLHSMIGVFSEIVSDRERFNGEPFSFFAKHGQATLATRVSINIKRLPKANETCIFKTWVSDYTNMRILNECQLFDKNGELLSSCKLTSRTISIKTLKAVSPQEFAGTLPELIYEDCGAPACKKIVSAFDPVFICSYPLQYCDVDTHGLMNNSHYTRLVFNKLPEEYAKGTPREYEINHTRRFLPGETMDLYGEHAENIYRMFGYVGDVQCFASEIRY